MKNRKSVYYHKPFREKATFKGEKPGKSSIQKQAPNNKSGGPYNAKNAANNAKNKLTENSNNTKKRDGSSSRKNSLTGKICLKTPFFLESFHFIKTIYSKT